MDTQENSKNIRLGKRLKAEIWHETIELADAIVKCQDGRKRAEMRRQFNALVDMIKADAAQ